LTLFLEQPGVPLDNNIIERSLKLAIRNRKNSLFYKTVVLVNSNCPMTYRF
jgi:hypothetical protein